MGLVGLLTSSCGGDRDGSKRADDSGRATPPGSSEPPAVGGSSASATPSAVAARASAVDVGDLCLPETLAAGQPLAVNVFPQGRCMSSSCTRWIENTCKVERQADRVVVHSRQLFQGGRPDQPCTEDCGGAKPSTCATTDPLPAGHYTLVYGKTEVGFDVPARFASSCIGGGATLTPAKP